MAPQLLRGEELEKLKPPPAVENLYRERVSRLKLEEKELLELISFLLRPMTVKEIEMMLNKKLSQFIGSLENLRRAGLVTVTTPLENVEVSNRALALNLLEHLEPAIKKEWHQKIAQGLEKLGGNIDEIAYHMAAGGVIEQARRFYIQAAEEYQKKNQFGVAARRYARAIALMKEGSAEWIDLSEETVHLSILAGDYQKAETVLEQLKNHSAYKTDHLRGWLAFKKRDFPVAKKF
ncbi:MAG: hypothetical protein Q7S68_05390, partial [Deltaproteobacteria bacterium]|nr:hypothetical protein [Deltaproteobacteria bacterium]